MQGLTATTRRGMELQEKEAQNLYIAYNFRIKSLMR